MGVARNTIEQKRTYLTKIAQEFHALASESLRGRYHNTEGNDMRLRMKVQHANDSFANEMKRSGHSVPFAELTSSLGEGKQPAQPGNGGDSGSGAFFFSNTQPSIVRPFCPQTLKQPFLPYTDKDKDSQVLNVYQSIPFVLPYMNHSFEELRLNDSVQAQSKPAPGLGFGSTPDKSSGGIFVTGASKVDTPSGFGVSNPAPNKSSGGVFGTGASKVDTPSPFGVSKPAPDTSSGGLFGRGTSRVDAPSLFAGTSTAAKNPVVPSFGQPPSLEIYQWIKDEIKASRGTELQGTMNPDVLPILFHKQARNWKAISESHLSAISGVTYTAVDLILQKVCGDELTEIKIDDLLSTANQESEHRGTARLLARIKKISSGHLQTNNPAFGEKVSEARRMRFHAALERYRSFRGSPLNFSPASTSDDSTGEDRLVIDMRDTASLFAELHISNSQNLEDEIHDTLKAYYDVARDHFVEHVNQEVVEPFLNDAEGPVFLFSPIYVAGLKDEEIEALAAEDEDMVRKRAGAEEKLARLKSAEKIALEYNSGGMSGHA
ncbi:hypothetical protein P7C71_g244, partial [Lecanoromycetidae sp. Uapishka_2]